jgi:hypothetical protein
LIDSRNRYVTSRDSRKVRIYATDAGGDYPIHGAVYNNFIDQWEVAIWTEEGFFFFGCTIHSLNLRLVHDEENND